MSGGDPILVQSDSLLEQRPLRRVHRQRDRA